MTSRSCHPGADLQNQELSRESVLAQLERIRSSPVFAKSERHRRFLTFVVQQTLDGNAAAVKEPVLAMEVFDRPADYDSKVDTIVRVEARRLRAKLADYYAEDGAADPIRIELPTGSYVPVLRPTDTPSAPVAVPAPARLPWAIAVGMLALAAIGLLHYARRDAAAAPRVAILPFQNLNPVAEDDLFADGITEALTTDLAKVPSFQVISRTSASRFKHAAQPLRDIAAALHADYVVEGSFQRTGERCRVTVQFIRASDDVHVWSEAYDLPFTDILRVQSEASAAIARQLRDAARSRWGLAAEGFRPEIATTNLEAYQAVLKARKNSNQYLFLGSPALYEDADRLLTRASQLDPNYADAIVERGLLEARRYQNTGDVQWRAKAEAAFLQALRLPPCHPVAAALMANIRSDQGDFDESLRFGRKAVECSPSSSQARLALGRTYAAMGFFEAAASEFRLAAKVDPLFVSPQLNLFAVLRRLGETREALAAARTAVDIEPQSPLALAALAYAYLETGQAGESAAAAERSVRSAPPEQTEGIRELLLAMRETYGGKPAEARARLRSLDSQQWLHGILWSGLYREVRLQCEEPATVLTLLEQEARQTSYRSLITTRSLHRLRAHPRYQTLLRARYQDWERYRDAYAAAVLPQPPRVPRPEQVLAQ